MELSFVVVMASIGATLITNLLNSANIVQSYGAGISRCGVSCERRRTVCSGHEDFKLRAGSFTCNQDSISSRKATVARASFDVAYEFEDAFSSLSLPLPPEPVLYPRKMLNLKFAVLLMRSAYEAVDALDFIAMDKFQIKVSLVQLMEALEALEMAQYEAITCTHAGFLCDCSSGSCDRVNWSLTYCSVDLFE